MEREEKFEIDRSKIAPTTSKVKAVIAWLVEADREFRAAQTLVDKTNKRF